MPNAARLVAAAALAALAIFTFAPEARSAPAKASVRRFSLAGHGTLEMTVPASWEEEVKKAEGPYPPTITLRSDDGTDRVAMHVTPLWSASQRPGFNSPAKVKALVERNGRDMLGKAEEAELSVRELPREHGVLYYFTLTGKDPKPGEYRCMTHAGLGTGGLLLVVTILTDTKDSKDLSRALEALRRARHLP